MKNATDIANEIVCTTIELAHEMSSSPLNKHMDPDELRNFRQCILLDTSIKLLMAAIWTRRVTLGLSEHPMDDDSIDPEILVSIMQEARALVTRFTEEDIYA